jgi:triphosphoribosyl-dephospho-CoA synthetase
MVSLLKFWRLRRIALNLAQRIGSESWKAGPRICEESQKAHEVLKSTREGNRVWDCVATVMAFGVHVVDHYARDFLDERERNRLVQKMLSSLMWEQTKASAVLAANEGRSLTGTELTKGEKPLLKLMRGMIDKFEQCYVMHLGGPGYRGDLGRTSLDMRDVPDV